MEKNNLKLFLIGLLLPTFSFASNRIVTLNPMISEWTAEILGQEKSQQKIIGASEYSNYPEYLKKVPTIGPYPRVHVEKILALHPDLVIASDEYNRPDQIEKLKKLKLQVKVLPKEHFFKMEEWILELGKILGEESSAKLAAENWKKSLKEFQTPTQKKKAFFQIQFQPLITVGGVGFLNDSFQLIGFDNVFSNLSQAYPKVSREAVLEKKPETVFVFEMVKDHEDLDKIKKTWKSSSVQVLNGDDFSRCSPRLLKALKGVR